MRCPVSVKTGLSLNSTALTIKPVHLPGYTILSDFVQACINDANFKQLFCEFLYNHAVVLHCSQCANLQYNLIISNRSCGSIKPDT